MDPVQSVPTLFRWFSVSHYFVSICCWALHSQNTGRKHCGGHCGDGDGRQGPELWDADCLCYCDACIGRSTSFDEEWRCGRHDRRCALSIIEGFKVTPLPWSGGTEAPLTPLSFAGFCNLMAMNTVCNDNPTAASRPFDLDRGGFVMSEGAGVLVLETLSHAVKRGEDAVIRFECCLLFFPFFIILPASLSSSSSSLL